MKLFDLLGVLETGMSNIEKANRMIIEPYQSELMVNIGEWLLSFCENWEGIDFGTGIINPQLSLA